MKIISNIKKLKKLINYEKKLGFVPTMGGIHKGHLSLIKKSINLCDKTVVSIFINKQQFNKNNDFKNYPRILTKDIFKLKKLKVNFLFLPDDKQIYHNGYNKKIKISSFAKRLCGRNRPGHFAAVADVIDRFIKIIKPRKIFFGEKDMQQFLIVKNFIKKNHPTTQVISCKTIRESNGIALSTRNFLLTIKEKNIASKIYKLLNRNKKKIIKKKVSLKIIKKMIDNVGVSKLEYIKVLNINKLIKPHKNKNRYKIFIAYYLGSTRLIDNI